MGLAEKGAVIFIAVVFGIVEIWLLLHPYQLFGYPAWVTDVLVFIAIAVDLYFLDRAANDKPPFAS